MPYPSCPGLMFRAEYSYVQSASRERTKNQHRPAVVILTSISKMAPEVEPSDKETMNLILRIKEKITFVSGERN